MSTPRRKSRNLSSPEAAFVEAMEGRRSLRDVLAQIDGHHGITSACRRHKRRTQVATSKISEEILEPPLFVTIRRAESFYSRRNDAMKGFVSTARATPTRRLSRNEVISLLDDAIDLI
jgi:hypothetical protein